MFKYITDLLFSEEREEDTDVYDEDEDASDEAGEDSDCEESESASDEEEDASDEEDAVASHLGGDDNDPEHGDHRCILSCDDLTVLQQFVDSIREQCIARKIAIGGSRDVIRGAGKVHAEESDMPREEPCDTVPEVGCDPQDPIPCECTKPKEE